MQKQTKNKASRKSAALSHVEAAYSNEALHLLGKRPDAEPVRQLVKGVAYHEAGHVVGRMFTGHEAGHVVLVSILPNGDSMGRERSVRNIGEFALGSYPGPIKRTTGRCLLLGLLAGEAAQGRVETSNPGWLEDEMFYRDSETWEQEGTDFYRAEKIAATMAGPSGSPHAVLRWAARWTEEMIALPDVWAAVEGLAGALIERGEITDREEIFSLCAGVLDMAGKSAKWRRRLFLSKAETAALFS